MNDFLKPINIPSLQDPHFQQSFNDFCVAIKQNFEKLISVQYTRGEKGTSIITKQVYLVESRIDEESHENVWYLNKMGATLLNAIFHTDIFNRFMNREDVEEALEEVANNICGYEVITWDKLTNTKVEVFIDPSAGKAYMSNPYIFIDGRIEGLPNYLKEEENETVTITDDTEDESVEMSEENAVDGDKYRTFNDFTCSVMGKATFRDEEENIIEEDYANQDDPATWDWTLDALEIVPKLYFDENNHEFCWKVNGQETQVTAQGLRGIDGTSTAVHIVKGRLESNNNYIRIDEVEYISRALDGNPRRVWHNVDPESSKDDEYNAFESIKDKDLVLAYYTIPGDNFQYAFMGQAIVVSDTVKKLYIGADQTTDDPRLDIFYSIMNQTIRQRMNLIHYVKENEDNPNGGTQNTVRGLFIKCRDIYHMLYAVWEEKDGMETSTNDIRLTPTDAASTDSNVREATVMDDDATFHIDYNVEMKNGKVHGDLEVDSNETVKGDVQVQGGASVQGAFEAIGDSLMRGNATVQGVTTLQDVIIKGSLVQEGDVRSDLKIKGTTKVSGINKQNDNNNSKFATACISEVRNVHTHIYASRIPTNFGAPNTQSIERQELLDKYYQGTNEFLKVVQNVKIGGNQYVGTEGLSVIGRRINIRESSPETFKVYLGISFMLHLTIGYLGYGQEFAKNSMYARRKSTTTTKRKYSDTALDEYLEYANMYNVCEYDVPCYAYREVYLGGIGDISNDDADSTKKSAWQAMVLDSAGNYKYITIDSNTANNYSSRWLSLFHQAEQVEDRQIVPQQRGWRQSIVDENGDKVDSTFIEFTAKADPINFNGELIYPQVKFNAKLSIEEGCSSGWTKKGNVPMRGVYAYNGWALSPGSWPNMSLPGELIDWDEITDSAKKNNDVYSGEHNINADTYLDVVFYQGSVEASSNKAFGLMVNDDIDSSIISGSAVSGLYGIRSSEEDTLKPVNRFAPLWPYQICEQGEIGNQEFKITTGEGLVYEDTPEDGKWTDAYRKYVLNVALPRMSALSADVVHINAKRVWKTEKKNGVVSVVSDKVTYSTEVNHTSTTPQRYISFFNNGHVGSNGLPNLLNESFDIVNIFRIANTDIMSGNANIYYETYNGDNGITDDIQATVDQDIDEYNFNEEVIVKPQVDATLTLAAQTILKRKPRLLASLFPTVDTNMFALATSAKFVPKKSDPDFVRGDNTIHVLGHSILEYTNGQIASTSSWYGRLIDPIGAGGIHDTQHIETVTEEAVVEMAGIPKGMDDLPRVH